MSGVGPGPTLSRVPGQFDHVDGTTTLAVPTCGGCCCCCCCCLATLAATPIVLGTVAADRAARHHRPRGGPITLAVTAFPAATVAAVAGGAVLDDGAGVLLGPLVAIVMLAFALGAGDEDDRAWAVGGAFLAGVLVPVAFVLEAIGGIALVALAANGETEYLGVVLYLSAVMGIVGTAGFWASSRAKARNALAPGPMPWTGIRPGPPPEPPMTTSTTPLPFLGPEAPVRPAPPDRPPPLRPPAAPPLRPPPAPRPGPPGDPSPWARPDPDEDPTGDPGS